MRKINAELPLLPLFREHAPLHRSSRGDSCKLQTTDDRDRGGRTDGTLACSCVRSCTQWRQSLLGRNAVERFPRRRNADLIDPPPPRVERNVDRRRSLRLARQIRSSRPRHGRRASATRVRPQRAPEARGFAEGRTATPGRRRTGFQAAEAPGKNCSCRPAVVKRTLQGFFWHMLKLRCALWPQQLRRADTRLSCRGFPTGDTGLPQPRGRPGGKHPRK